MQSETAVRILAFVMNDHTKNIIQPLTLLITSTSFQLYYCYCIIYCCIFISVKFRLTNHEFHYTKLNITCVNSSDHYPCKRKCTV
jgi:hypothetical protein